MKRILYIYPVEAPFVDKDIAILGREFMVDKRIFNYHNVKSTLLQIALHKWFLLINIWKYDAVMVMFAGVPSFITGLFTYILGKQLFITVGGTDCVSFPSIQYGNFYSPLLRFATKVSYNLSNHVISVHESLIISDNTYNASDYPNQGIKFHFPNFSTPFSVIHNGYDSTLWYKNKATIKGRFITVASYANNETRRKLKGVDLIIELAKKYPNFEFYIIGAQEQYFPIKLQNIKLISWVNNNELIDYFSQSQFYLQLSMSEGFPNALCEAMLCECVPIVSAVASMPEIVGSSGFILPQKDLNLLTQIIEKALQSDLEKLGKAARHRISSQYTEQMRAEKLNSLIKNLMNKK